MLNKMFDEFNNQYGLETTDIYSCLDSMHGLIKDEVEELDEEIFEMIHHGLYKEAEVVK